MSFKYLFCIKDSQKYSSCFEHCHMPLDSYTLTWYNSKRKNMRVKDAWSSLSEDQYLNIQKDIRVLLKQEPCPYTDEEKKPLCPFLAEFYIWKAQIENAQKKENIAVLNRICAEKNKYSKEITDLAQKLRSLLEQEG